MRSLLCVLAILVLVPKGIRGEPGWVSLPQPTASPKACHICDEGLPGAATAPPFPSLTPSLTPEPESCQECRLTADRIYALSTMAARVRASEQPAHPVVQGLPFWMEGCPHCHEVLYGVLPELERLYGERLEIYLVEIVSQEDVDALFAAAAAFGVPKEAVGVPMLILGQQVLIGSKQIPAELPGLIERNLQDGGLRLPQNEALEPFTTRMQEFTLEEGPARPVGEDSPAPAARPGGFGLAVAVLVGMAGALLYGLLAIAGSLRDWTVPRLPAGWARAIPWLTLAGMAVAGYLAYVERRDVAAVCGPVGDCNAVQQSPYAMLWGFLPVGVLGLLGYVAILGVWLWRRGRSGPHVRLGSAALFGLTTVGLVFSLYLTYLEPFVIRAVCLWCLSSSVIMTLLFLLSVASVIEGGRSEGGVAGA